MTVNPLAVVWKGLPWPPEEILERKKSIIHSTKDHDGLREVDVRRFFADHRATVAGDTTRSIHRGSPGRVTAVTVS